MAQEDYKEFICSRMGTECGFQVRAKTEAEIGSGGCKLLKTANIRYFDDFRNNPRQCIDSWAF
jgi:hypothetical protein